jgi:hypothetical protein
MMRKVSRQADLPDNLAKLYQHYNACKGCQAAVKADDIYMMCDRGIKDLIAAMRGYANLYKLRQKAHNRPGGCIYACPDLTAHGEAYVVTAPALIVTGIQDSLL